MLEIKIKMGKLGKIVKIVQMVKNISIEEGEIKNQNLLNHY